MARQKERYYAFLLPKSAVTGQFHGATHQMRKPRKHTKETLGRFSLMIILLMINGF